MGSGIFPLYEYSNTGKKIIDIINYLKDLRDGLDESVFTGDSGGQQYDNTAIDGMGLARLEIAIHCLEECVYIEEPKKKA